MADTVTAEGQSGTMAQQTEGGPSEEIAPGDCLGRYTVTALVGAGGMGRVYAAIDHELGRSVALKVIRPDRASPSARNRLLREAQALARLDHPNVVTIHEVGSDGDNMFVAMELVDGVTLDDWLAAEPRSWRAVRDVFLAAGRGLVAAHAAGIVHRDFKPHNVIVGGERVVVVDFGLARTDAEPAEPEAGLPTQLLDLALTLTGERVGTPRYMAPEQRAGGPVTAKADQFAFCIALRDALEPRAGAAGDAPRFVMQAIERGLAASPDDRWPSIDALLATLGKTFWTPRRKRLAGATTAMLVVAVAVLGFTAGQRAAAPEPCASAAGRLAGVWDPARKTAVQAAFAATGLAFHSATWRGVEARLDDYAARWLDGYHDACHATRVDGRQSDTLMDLRMSCFERRRAVLGGLTDLWAAGVDAEALGAAIDAARGLPALADCSDGRALTERIALPAAAEAVAKVAAARTQVDAVRALTLAHHWQIARTRAREARTVADATDWPAVRAEAAFAEGDVLSNLSDPASEAALVEAVRLAGAARDDSLAARALTALVKSLAVDGASAPRALLAADIADGAIARAGNDPALRAMLLRNRGDALVTAGKFAEARAAFSRARDAATAAFGADDSATLWITAELARVQAAQGETAAGRALGEANLAATIRVLGAEHPSVASTLTILALAAGDAMDNDAAAAYLQRALAIKERVGGDTAWTATTLNNLGNIELERGQVVHAEALHQRALAIRTRVLASDHPLIAQSLASLAYVRRKQGRYAEAIDLLRRAIAIETAAYGPIHPTIGAHLMGVGDALDSKGDFAGALEQYRRALDVRRQALGANHPDTLFTLNQLGDELVALHRCGEARPALAEALAGLERIAPDHVYLGDVLDGLALCDLADGHAAAAAERLVRALAIEEKITGESQMRGSHRWHLARALWALGRRDAAIAAARTAEQELATDPDGDQERAEAHAWLAARGAK